MTHATRRNSAASVHQRLLDQARASDRTFQELLQAYSNERFLYRLSQSPYATQFVLKGALLLTAWGLPGARPTRDIDFLGYGYNAIERLREIIQAVCTQTVPPDGLRFDPETTRAERIQDDADYKGMRVRFVGYLGKARLAMQVDVGFADVVSPAPQMITLPTILDMPAPELRCYSRESVIAEKLQAMVFLGPINSRMKDFYDIWSLSRHFTFEGDLLQDAIRQTFVRRKSQIPDSSLAAFSVDFVQEKQLMWQTFLQRNRLSDVPKDFSQVTSALQVFLSPILQALLPGEDLALTWTPGLGWGESYKSPL